jgi:hypothetical protein
MYSKPRTDIKTPQKKIAWGKAGADVGSVFHAAGPAADALHRFSDRKLVPPEWRNPFLFDVVKAKQVPTTPEDRNIANPVDLELDWHRSGRGYIPPPSGAPPKLHGDNVIEASPLGVAARIGSTPESRVTAVRVSLPAESCEATTMRASPGRRSPSAP